MNRNFKYLLGLMPGILVVTGNSAGGWWVSLNTVFSLGLLAILENFVAENKNNESTESIFFPDAILFLHFFLQLACISTMVYAVKHNDFNFLQGILLSVSTGTNTGASAIVIAHELIHRKNKFYRLLGKILLFTAGNIYFYVDHLRVHHKWVGTSKDPATAMVGENVYGFFIRSVSGQIKSSCQLERSRLQGRSFLFSFLANYVTLSTVLLLLVIVSLAVFINLQCAVVFILQVVMANFLLEYTNYIEHYGLTRKEDERVIETHSWQSDKVISRYFLIDLSRHADHHYYASKPYHSLKSYETSPVLPHGYVAMIYYALIPSLWFKTVDKRLKEFRMSSAKIN